LIKVKRKISTLFYLHPPGFRCAKISDKQGEDELLDLNLCLWDIKIPKGKELVFFDRIPCEKTKEKDLHGYGISSQSIVSVSTPTSAKRVPPYRLITNRSIISQTPLEKNKKTKKAWRIKLASHPAARKFPEKETSESDDKPYSLKKKRREKRDQNPSTRFCAVFYDKLMFERHFDPLKLHDKDEDGRTLLHFACFLGIKNIIIFINFRSLKIWGKYRHS